MNELALFAGAGGGILGGVLLGWRIVCAVELEPYAASVLVQRQNDGILPPFPVWDDVQTFDGRPWRGLVDVVSGGFPCQDISSAGKGVGIDGERSGLWSEMARIVNEVRPQFVFVENSPILVGRGLARVLGDLAKIVYDSVWDIVGADDVGAPHVRKRIWILAYDTNSNSLQCPEQEQQYKGPEVAAGGSRDGMEPGECVEVANSELSGLEGQRRITWDDGSQVCNTSGEVLQDRGSSSLGQSGSVKESERSDCEISDYENQGAVRRNGSLRKDKGFGGERGDFTGGEEIHGVGQWWEVEPNVGRVANGVAARVDRLKAIGNGQVPIVAATAFSELLRRIK